MKLPVITFEFGGGTKWDVKPEAYMEAANKNDATGTQWQGKRSFTSRIYVDEPHGGKCFIPYTTYEFWTDFFKPFFIFFNYYAISLNFLVISCIVTLKPS